MQDLQAAQSISEHGPIVIEGVSVFIGILAGTLVQYLLDWIRSIVRNRKHLAAVRFEMNYVRRRVAGWRALARDLRNAVNGDTPGNATQIFDFSKVPLVASLGLVNSGRAYGLLGDVDLAKLLETMSYLTIAWDNVVSAEIMKIRNNFNKQYAVQHVNWLDQRLTDLDNSASAVLQHL